MHDVKYKIRNVGDYLKFDKELIRTYDPMKEIAKQIQIEKDKIIRKEILNILKQYYKEFEECAETDYTSEEIIEILTAKDIIVELEEPKFNITYQSLNPNGNYSYGYHIENPKVKLYRRL